MADPVFTIILPTRNRLTYLKEAIKSVRAQAGEWELVVVVDGSTDGTVEWLSGLEDRRVLMRVLTEQSGIATARNTGFMAARGRYVLPMDDDDRLAPGTLRSLGAALDRFQEAVAAVGATMVFDNKGQRRRLRHPRRTLVRNVSADVMFGWPVPPGSSLFRTEVLRAVGGWRDGLTQGEDQDLWLRLASRGPVALIPEIVLYYRRHEGQHRPENTYEIERALREAFVATLSGEEQRMANAVLQARLLRERGVEAWRRNDRRQALRCFAASVRAAPHLLYSPVNGWRVRSLLLRSLVGVVAGARVTAGTQQLIWKIRQRRRRAPGGPEPILPPTRRRTPPPS